MFESFPIDKERIEDYGDLIPDCYYERLKLDEIFAVATVDTSSGASDEDVLVGVVIVGLQESWVKILWYALTPDYDTPDYARDLIRDRVFDAYHGGKALGVFAELPVQGRKNDLFEIFKTGGFDVSFSESKVVSFPLKSLIELTKVNNSRDFITLGKASNQIKNVLGNLMAHDRRAIPIEIPVKWENYNKSLSLIHMKGDKPVGAILNSISGKSVIVELAYEHSPQGFILLVSALIELARTLLPPDVEIIVPLVETRLVGFLKKLAPEAEGAEVMKAYYRFNRENMEGYFENYIEEDEEPVQDLSFLFEGING